MLGVRERVILAVAFLALVSGCAAPSSTRVTTQSIVNVPAGTNLIADATFRQGTAGPWHVTVPAGSNTSVEAIAGTHFLNIAKPPPVGSGPLTVEQSTDVLPSRAAGSEYDLRVQIRMVDVSEAISTQIRLNYQSGGYAFFTGRPVGGGGAGPLRGTTNGWVTVRVRARAELPLDSIEAFALDTGTPSAFSGTIWITGAELSLVHR